MIITWAFAKTTLRYVFFFTVLVQQNALFSKEVRTNEDINKNHPVEISNFSLPDTNGKVIQLKDLQAKKVYIKFWASWCSICLAGIDELSELVEEKSKDKNVLILTIVAPGFLSEKSKKDFIFWYNKQGFKPMVLLDNERLLLKDFEIKGYPTSVFIGTNGKLAKIHRGHLKNSEIEKILKEMI